MLIRCLLCLCCRVVFSRSNLLDDCSTPTDATLLSLRLYDTVWPRLINQDVQACIRTENPHQQYVHHRHTIAQILSFLELTTSSATKLIKIYQAAAANAASDYVLKGWGYVLFSISFWYLRGIFSPASQVIHFSFPCTVTWFQEHWRACGRKPYINWKSRSKGLKNISCLRYLSWHVTHNPWLYLLRCIVHHLRNGFFAIRTVKFSDQQPRNAYAVCGKSFLIKAELCRDRFYNFW